MHRRRHRRLAVGRDCTRVCEAVRYPTGRAGNRPRRRSRFFTSITPLGTSDRRLSERRRAPMGVPLVRGRRIFARFWSGRRGSNPRPRPWQGRALPLSYTRVRKRWRQSKRRQRGELCQMRPVNATAHKGQNSAKSPDIRACRGQILLEPGPEAMPRRAPARRHEMSPVLRLSAAIRAIWRRSRGASRSAHRAERARSRMSPTIRQQRDRRP